MRFRCFQSSLAAAAVDAARAMPARPAAPVLNAMRITASEDGQVELVGYDFDVCIRAVTTADVIEPGQVLVPGRPFAAFLAGMPDGMVGVEEVGARLQLKMPHVRFGLNTMSVEDYPGLPETPTEVGTIPAADLSRALGKILPSARPLLGTSWSGAVQLTATADQLTLTATDRYTVAVTSTPWKGICEEPVTAEVSAKALSDALRGMSGDVSVRIDVTGIGVVGPERTFTSRRLDVDYPQCREFVERLPEPATRVMVRADDLLAAMTQAARVVAEERNPVRLTISPDEGLSYDAHAEGKSQLDGDIEVEQITGPPIVLAVNPAYLCDALKAFAGSLVEIGARGPLKALSITSPDAPGDIHAIQPIKFQ